LGKNTSQLSQSVKLSDERDLQNERLIKSSLFPWIYFNCDKAAHKGKQCWIANVPSGAYPRNPSFRRCRDIANSKIITQSFIHDCSII